MSLQPKVTYPQQVSGTVALLNETTGDYNQYNNAGGYGSPNVASSAITSAIFTMRKSDHEAGISLELTISSNVITAAQVLDEFGQATDVLSQLTNTVFPLVNQELTSKILYGTTNEDILASGAYYCTYTVSDGTDSWMYSFWQFFIYDYDKCYQEATTRIADRTITEDQAIDIFLQYDLLCNFIGLANPDSAIQQMKVLDGLCFDCGCGCSKNP